MLDTLSLLPFSFWMVVILMGYGVFWASEHVRDGLGLPVMAVLGTIGVWYIGDVLYNDYQGNFIPQFSPDVLSETWWEVFLFISVFLYMSSVIHRRINRSELHHSGRISQMLRVGVELPRFQSQLRQLFWVTFWVWAVITTIAVIRVAEDAPYYFFPFLGQRADPWSRERIGSGFDSLLSLAGYVQMFTGGMFGMLAALLKDRRLRALAVAGCLLTWPYFIFDRTRNPMLVVVGPAMLSWVFLRLRGSVLQKGLVLGICFLVINAWFAFVIANRTNGSISSALGEKGFDVQGTESVHHEGLNMYEELCWINTFISNGSYQPNWGKGYFAEVVNPIPRALWPGKPMIGIEYAILRGQSSLSNGEAVTASVSTGMIGQGVVNLGRIVGPIFAALLMSLWAAILAGLDLRGHKAGYIPLFGLGLVLTFNLGRDITLITLYTFVFGYLIVWGADQLKKKKVFQKFSRVRSA